MKKSSFAALVLGAIGTAFFALGMCMVLIEEWSMFRQGIVCGVIGLAVLLADLLVWRRMEGKAPIRLKAKTVGAVVLTLAGALLLGVGMCLTMVFSQMAAGVGIGLAGIAALLMLIPLTRGLRD